MPFTKKINKKMLRYTKLAAEVEKCGWKARLRPGCWGITAEAVLV